MNIAHNLERSQRLFPQKLALIFEDQSFTYRELNEQSNQIANGLAHLGIKRGDRVALWLPNLPAFITSYFGLQKLGAVAVTLNTGLKAQETTFILNDCQAQVLITTADLLHRQLVATELLWVKHLFLVEGEVEVGAAELLLTKWQGSFSSQAQALDLERDEPAVIIYTSGTTGFPKGATLSQGNIVSTVRMVTYTLRLDSSDRIMLCLPAFHNYGQYATFNPCIDAAATLILHREFEPDPILRSILEHQVTSFFGVPTLYNLLYEKALPEQLTSFKRCISAGAPLPEKLANQWQEKFGLVINQIYGLTECSMVGFNHFFKYQPGSIGSPVEGTELKIVNETGQTVPAGELGEIVVRGPNVMLGYWNRPEATAEAIKAGWFYTGDIGRLDEDGYVYLVDRRKDMVNVGGEKVYPAEVEQVLLQHPAVSEAAVYGVPESLLGEQVRANLILKAGQAVTAEALIEFSRRALADYKVPNVIQFVESLPKGRTGKVLKRLLREAASASLGTGPASAIPSPHSPSITPKTATAQRVWLSQWLHENLSLTAPVAVEQPFNEYGLTSLLAVKLVTALNEWLGTSFEPIIVWNYPTINRLITYLTQTPESKPEVSRLELWPAIDPYHVYDPLMYQRMRDDTARTEIYRLAIERTIANKVVLEIGPGPEANLTRLCAEAGAKHIYAVELDATAFRQAQQLVNQLGLTDKITLIHGDVTKISLPELADACVSGLAGQIGGSEGVVALLNQTRRLLTPDALIIPQRYISKIAAVTLPDLPTQFTPLGWQYTQKIFDQIGHPFDLRVIINHFDPSAMLSDCAIFEEIDFTVSRVVNSSYQHDFRLTITRSGRLDGFIIWLTLETIDGVTMDVLEQGNLWLPVYFPTFHPGLRVSAGDVIEATAIGSLSDNQINPDYRLTGRLIRAQEELVVFDHWSPHHDHYFQRSAFYRELFKHRPTKSLTIDSSLAATETHSATVEPIAIIGLSCRFPGGAETPDKFWELLKNGVDTVAAIPSERWDIESYYDANPEALGKMYVRAGSFLPEVDKFDAAFFGLPPLETRSLDPQQRLLLEVAWESLEHAGIAPQSLQHSQTGLFIGSFWDDYSTGNLYQAPPEQIDAYRILSSLRGMHAGRLSYLFQFHGPAMQIDTACSSSLLAIHLACQSLRAQECELAVAGGVTLFFSPEVLIGLSRTHALAPDGRSKPFAANADGFGVGEGAGTVVLKRLSEAKRDGDKILAVIKGSAVNHDGPSNGLTAPNGLAQEAVLRQALQNAHLSPDQIDYLEAHGTGTPLGDPIEVAALSQVFTPGRTRSLIIGSVKSNIGHLSAAAGIASLIKVVLSLQHGLIPPSLHFNEPNPYIRWEQLPLLVPTQPMNWPNPARLAGISSFGMTGTNVHLIVGEAPPPEILNSSVSTLERPFHLLTLSGKTEPALSDQVTRYLDYLTRHPELNLADVCYTANTGRNHFEHRLAVTAKDLNELRTKLQKGEGVKGYLAKSSLRPVAFLFTGQGSQSVDMGRELFETHPLFRQILEQCEAILRNYLPTPLLELLYGDEKEKQNRLLAETQYTQPALFAIEYALAKLWQSWGVEPAVLIGHSVGEYVAACVAEVFSLEDGLKLIAERGRLMQALPPNGSMVAVTLDEATLTPILQPYLEQVSIASFNAPHSLVLSGHTDRVEEIIKSLETQGIKCKRLAVSHAFHSPLMTPMLAEFERVARSITYHPPRLQLVSNVTGQLLTEVKADYWVQHVRQPVRFAQGLATVADLGVKVFIEVGPKPTLLGLGQLSVPGSDLLWLPSLYPKQSSDWSQLLESLATFHVHGGRVDWRRFDQPYSRQKVSLPTYPFQRQRYWLDQRARTHSSVESRHPLVGPMIRLPNSAEVHFQAKLSANQPAYLSDHRVFGQPILPGTAHLEMALAAGQELFKEVPVNLANITFQQPLMLTTEEKTVQLVFTPVTEGYHWQIFSWQEDQQEWFLHSVGEIQPELTTLEAWSKLIPNQLAELQNRCATEMSVPAHYQFCADQGLHYGPEFQGLEKLFQGESEALGLIRLSPSLQLETSRYQLHPALLDACLQVSIGTLSSDTSEAHLPLALERFQLDVTGPHQVLWSYAQVRPATKDSTRLVDFTLFSEKGSIIAQLTGLMLRPASRETVQKSGLRTDWLYQLTWQTATLPTHSPYTTEPGRWLIIGDQALSQPLADLLQVHGEQVVRHQTVGETYRSVVYLGLDLTTLQEWSNLPEAALKVATEVLQLVQGLIQGQGTPRLWLVSQEGHLASSVLWGLGRTLMWEHPELQCSCLELSTETAAATLFETLWYADSENQIALRQGRRHLARLDRFKRPELATPPYPCQLQLGQYGLFETLHLIPATRQPPQAGQVEVQVRAAGLNFRDVLNALGLLKEYYPKELGYEDPTNLPFGFEGAGTVVTVGAAVTEFQLGDEVMIWLGLGSLASFITVEAKYLTRKPPHLSFEEAATIPIAFLTAYYGLHELAQLQAGERVLIHAAAGGVGQAAIQMAQYLEAEILATASPPKWNFLKSLGIKQVMNSRTLEFAEQIQTLTAGQGVEVVLNSLNGEYIAKSFEVLAARGRFIEIGKIGIWDQEQASRYRPQAYYTTFDLNEVRQQNPELVVSMQAQLYRLFANRELKPLPYQVFPLAQASEAFQLMAQTKHLGKIVLSIPDHQTPKLNTLQANSSYLITGGLGGLGLTVAAWLVEQGASHLVLSSRRGLENEAAQQAVHQLENLGAKVLVVKADVSQEADVARLLAAAQQFAPLRGIIHAAGLLDDGMVLQQTPERLAKVLAPKVQGSWYLHQFSQDLPLEFFVGFSSVASLLGHGGQANYAAANAFLDALMSHRQALGLPGLSINWSAWSEVGMAANIVGEWGKEVISPAQGVALLGYLLNHSVAQVGVIPWQWANFGRQLPVGSHFPLLTQFLKPKVVTTAKSALRQQLAQASGAAREELLKQHLRAEIQTVVGITPTDEQGFFELGMDSLQSIQLGNRLAASLEVSLPATLTLEYPTVDRLTNHLATVLGWKTVATASQSDIDKTKSVIETVQLSSDEVETSITHKLANLEALLDD